jgi:dTDP-4-amino-4,6-dideoxygalactose transaminase
MKVPFNRPVIYGSEIEHIKEAIALQRLAGDGEFTERCHALLKHTVQCSAAMLTHSCTAALEMAAILIDLKPGDEVIMPSFTFVSTANAVVLRGATPVFVDIRPDTLNIDEELLACAVTERTKAIFPVHYAGVPAEMDIILDFANRRNLLVVEDAAQALGSTYRGRPAGSLGHLAAFSFHETKNIISGEGGALAINDPAFVKRAEIIREKGTNRKQFFRGAVDKYTWMDIGSSFLPGELVAAFLFGQLQNADSITADRQRSWLSYDQAMREYVSRGLVTPTIPNHCQHNAHIYYIVLPTLEMRGELLRLLHEDGISSLFHYVPLHSSPAGQKFGRASGSLALTTDLSERLARLPLYPQMGGEIHQVIERLTHHLDRLL